MGGTVNRIVILENNVKGDLFRCNICGVNYTAIQPCMICQLIIEKENELGRKLTKDEFMELGEFLK